MSKTAPEAAREFMEGMRDALAPGTKALPHRLLADLMTTREAELRAEVERLQESYRLLAEEELAPAKEWGCDQEERAEKAEASLSALHTGWTSEHKPEHCMDFINHYRKQLAEAQARVEKLWAAILEWRAAESLIDCSACAALEAAFAPGNAEEASRG